MEKCRIIYDEKANEYTFSIKTERTPRKISAHRFLSLIGRNTFASKLQVMLDFLAYWKIKENPAMALGKFLEKPILDSFLTHYEMFDYETYGGDCFKEPNGVFGGLLDAWDPVYETIYEVKTYFMPTPEKFYNYELQLAFYWSLWPKAKRAIVVGCKTEPSDYGYMKKGVAPKIDVERLYFKDVSESVYKEIDGLKKHALSVRETLFQPATDTEWTYQVTFHADKHAIDHVKYLRANAKDWGLEIVV